MDNINKTPQELIKAGEEDIVELFDQTIPIDPDENGKYNIPDLKNKWRVDPNSFGVEVNKENDIISEAIKKGYIK